MDNGLILLFILISVSCSRAQTFNTFIDPRDGKEYRTVQIGKQIWMAENLQASRFRNGETIPVAMDQSDWGSANKESRPSFGYYENDSTHGKMYGKLYNWYTLEDPRGLAPKGWHIPTTEEWEQLITFLSGDTLRNDAVSKKMKKSWMPDDDSNNESGFSALPGGTYDTEGDWKKYKRMGKIGFEGWWWRASSEMGINAAGHFAIGPNFFGFALSYIGNGLSVRCVKD